MPTESQHSEPARELSRQQMLMWTGQQLEPNSPIYNMAFWIEIPTAIDVDAFKNAFRTIVNASKSLRSTIQLKQGLPQLHVKDQVEYELEFVDFSRSNNDVEAWYNNRCREMFDLEKCMFATALVKLSDERYGWYIAHHHLISDAWAGTQLLRMQSELYSEIKSGNKEGHAELEPEFPECGTDPRLEPNKIESNPISFYGNKPPRIRSKSERVSIVENGDEASNYLQKLFDSKEAKTFSKDLSQLNVTMTLLFAYLHRVSGQQRLSIGVPFHNRLTPAERKTLGVFIELFPVTVEINENESFRTLFKRVQVASNDYLRSATSKKQVIGSNVNFNVVLNYIHARFDNFDSVPVMVKWLHSGCSDRQHHLRMHVENFSACNQSHINFDFNQDIFDRIQRRVAREHFRTMVAAMSENWDTPIGSVDLLTKEEKSSLNQVMPAQGATKAQQDHQNSVIDQLAAIEAHTPNVTAVTCGRQSWSYAELNDRVLQIVKTLSRNNFELGSRIAVCLPRSMDAVASILAALKSGFAFVPVDPAWPASRIEYVLNDCKASCIVTTSTIDIESSGKALRLDLDTQEPSVESISNWIVEPNQTAYVLYTSGSTGEPKGVEISHASLLHYVNWAADFYGQGNPLAFPLFTPMTFDLTLTSIFVPLLTGGQIVIYPEQSGSDIALLDVIADDMVDIIKLTPSHLSLLEGKRLKSSRVRQLILGGENLRLDVAKNVLDSFTDGLVIHNEYGPTEATVGCIVYSLDANSDVRGISVPIGRPITGMQSFVLNESLQHQPVGVEGELFLAGNGLAKGYFDQPELTAAKFIDNPFQAGSRLYRTGDIARVNREGVIEYLGRKDQQVKIRGARIELGAIESALREHPRISHAVVTTFKPETVNQHLEYCSRCGLASNYPDTEFDDQLVCNQCRAFESYRDKASVYFHSMNDLQAIFDSKKNQSADYDCISLLSGGKDSTYMLARLADMGLRILAFTLDNGYISDEAKANIRRVVEALGVDHHFASTPAMNQIFVDSLKRYSNVCQGCFKTIYTLSVNFATEKNIPFICTGLSRGQFFETRLTEDLFRDPGSSLVQIEQTVVDARKAYHRVDDAVSQLLDVRSVQQEETFEKVQFVDFYRYCDVELEEMLSYLDKRLPWVRPSDTGRSTNCLINDVGIYVHKRNEGFHNYAHPYAWDVRMGHKQRDAALEELDDEINVDDVHRILQEIGYDGELVNPHEGERLVAYFTSDHDIAINELNAHIGSRLPSFMSPGRFVKVDSIPTTSNGKVDFARLPDPTATRVHTTSAFVSPTNETEAQLSKVWCDVLRVPQVGIHDNFFDLGGDSILAIQIVARANRAGIRITPSHLFNSLTVQKLAEAWANAEEKVLLDVDAEPVLTPIQHWALEHQPQINDFWNQSIEIRLPTQVDVDAVRESLTTLCNHHATLRTKVDVENGALRHLGPLASHELPLLQLHLAGMDLEQADDELRELKDKLNRLVGFDSDHLLVAAIIQLNENDCRLLLVSDHMAVDAVSWQHLIGDFEEIYQAKISGKACGLERTPLQATWSNSLTKASEQITAQEIEYWRSMLETPSPVNKPSRPERTVADLHSTSMALSAEVTKELEQSASAAEIRLHEILIAVLAKSLGQCFDQKDMRIMVERHGREQINQLDFSRTVGWFTSLAPVRVSLPDDVDQTLISVKEQLRSETGNGIGYGLLRYLVDDTKLQSTLRTSTNEVVFNFLGKSVREHDEPFSISHPLQLHRSPSLRQLNAIEFNVTIDNCLRINCDCDQQQFTADEIQQLTDRIRENVSVMTTQLNAMASHNVLDKYPLSPMQKGMLFHTISEPESGVYVDQVAIRLDGEIETSRFADSIQRVFSRFDTLRTACVWDGVAQPTQVVHRQVDFPFEFRDWQSIDEQQQRQHLLDLVDEQKSRSFELEKPPLIRTVLCKYSANQWQLVLVFHHLVLDGWSTQTLTRELISDYENGSPAVREEFRFRDYVDWILNQDQESAELFWKKELLGFDSPSEIGPPRRKTNSNNNVSQRVQQHRHLSGEFSQRLQEFARSERVTLNTLMQAAWSIMVSRYSGGDTDIVFGTTVAGRPLSLDGIESGIGSFINTIPFRTQLKPESQLGHWFQEIQARQADYREWEFSSLVQVQKQAEIPAGSSLFESILVFENYPANAENSDGLHICSAEHFEQSNYPLAFLVVPSKEIELILIVDGERYSAEFAQRVLEHLECTLNQFTKGSSQEIKEALWQLPPEQKSKLIEWNTPAPVTSTGTIDELIWKTASNNANAVALSFGDQRLSYGELVQRANKVANRLIDSGLQLNEPVGLLVERSTEMIVGILGILKAGGYYVPLDVIYPQDHIRHVLDDTKARIVLTKRQHVEQILDSESRTLLFLDEVESFGESDPPILAKPNQDRLAYAIYTSGSTGKPKGVLITHKNLAQSTLARTDYYAQVPTAYLLLSSFAFDSSVAGIFWTLCSGGTLVLPRQDAEKDIFELANLIESEKVSHLLCLPALYQLLTEAAQPGQLDSLQVAIVAGESVSTDVAKAHFQSVPHAELHNEYGPTEGTVWATAHPIQSTDIDSVIPIGKPIKPTGIALLDADQNHVPIGSLGEIYLSGGGVAAGYLNRSGLTKEKFVSLENVDGSDKRMYRTGDVGHFLDDGSLVFCGRVDRQVKVRGYRIELGEIESALLAFPNVTDAAVVAHRPNENASYRILAFVVGEQSSTDSQTWQLRLRERLPSFMIPDDISCIDRIPRLPNSKVDVNSLPTELSRDTHDNFVAPRNEVEERLASIWQEAIGVEQVGVHDNFFSLGGDSIISIQVISRARRERIRIQPRDIANHPTVAGLSEIARLEAEESHTEQSVGETGLTPIQRWFFERNFANPNHWNQSQLFALKDGYDFEKLQLAIAAVIERHATLNSRFEQLDGEWTQRIAAEPSATTIETFDGLLDDQAAFHQQCHKLQSSLNIQTGPQFRLARFSNTSNGADQLLVVVHHLVIDAVSWRILIDDIEFAYQNLDTGKSALVSDAPTAFGNWSKRLSELAVSPETTVQLDSMLKTLAEVSPVSTDFRVKETAAEVSAETISTTFDKETTQDLRSEANRPYNTTTHDLLVSSLVLTLAEWTGTAKVAIEIEGHGRSSDQIEMDTSGTVGWFTSVYPESFDAFPGDIGKTIRGVKERLRSAHDNGLTYGLLRYVNPKTRGQLADFPNPNVLFNFLGAVGSSNDKTLLVPISGAHETSRDQRNAKTHPLEFSAVIKDDILTVELRYSSQLHRPESGQNLIAHFTRSLKAIVDHCRDQETGYTPSDFAESGLTQDELNDFLDDLN